MISLQLMSVRLTTVAVLTPAKIPLHHTHVVVLMASLLAQTDTTAAVYKLFS